MTGIETTDSIADAVALLAAVVLFIFAIGYKVGPQFFQGLRGEGLRTDDLRMRRHHGAGRER